MKNSNPTLKSIALKLGVSVTTVSRALNGKSNRYRISKETELKILKAAKELAYSPNQLARGLRLKRTNTIGYIIPDISNPFFASIAKSVEKSARKFGYSIILCDSEESTDIEKESLQLMLNRKVDGLIISPVGLEVSHLVAVSQKNIPIVLLDRYFPNLNLPFVTSDNYQGALEAVNLLIENGHTRIACIQGLKNTSPNNDRVRGYKDAHLNKQLTIDESLIVGDSFGEDNGYIETKLLLRKNPLPTAIFSVSNLISLGAIRAISEEGLKIPEDISMISFDDQPYSRFLSTPMTTVSQQSTQIGQIATKLLLDQIESKRSHDPQGIFLPTKIILRDSIKRNINLKLKSIG
ncbi:MAG TPA: transcriptional regulator [Ignavibacteriales bacterium]|nr:transcriptional regulator [Ignavibacteriales bacterium]